MRVRGLLGAAWIGVGLWGCAPPAQVGAGAQCNSLNECKPGLSCIEGVCDTDLTSIAGQVPMYADAAVAGTGGTGGGAGGTTGAGAGAGGTAGSGGATGGTDAGAR